jgi:hypothetical protein
MQWMVSPGNHEIESDYTNNETFRAYKARFAMPEDAPESDTTTYAELPCFKIDPATGLCPASKQWCTPSAWTVRYN